MSTRKEKEIRSERISLYYNLIWGITFSGMAIGTIIYFTLKEGIRNVLHYTIGLTFLSLWLITCVSLIIYGIYLSHLEKKHPEKLRKKKDLKPPIVS